MVAFCEKREKKKGCLMTLIGPVQSRILFRRPAKNPATLYMSEPVLTSTRAYWNNSLEFTSAGSIARPLDPSNRLIPNLRLRLGLLYPSLPTSYILLYRYKPHTWNCVVEILVGKDHNPTVPRFTRIRRGTVPTRKSLPFKDQNAFPKQGYGHTKSLGTITNTFEY